MSLTLLPAVDVADGQAVRLVQGAAGSETAYGDPLEAALAWQRDGAEWVHLVDLDAAFGRGSNAAPARRGGGAAGRGGGALRRDPGRRVAAGGAGHRRGPGQHRHRRAGGPGVVRPDGRRVRRPGGDRAGRARPHAVGARAGPATAATCSRCWRGWTRPAAPVRGHRHHQGRHDARARTWICCARSARRTDAPVIASGGVSTLDDLRALADAGADRRGGRDRRQGALRGRVHRGRGAADRWVDGVTERARLGSGGPWEGTFGYSRVVRAGGLVLTAGCTSTVDGVSCAWAMRRRRPAGVPDRAGRAGRRRGGPR